MARGQIIVTTTKLETTASTVESEANSYKNSYTALFSLVKEMENAWAGEDNLAFTNQIEGFRNDFQAMEQLMKDYATFLRKVASTLRETQDNVAAAAKNLSQGN